MKLDDRLKELIAIGASVSANCQPCLEYHVAKAREFGAAEEEINEAVQVGRTVRKGAAAKMDSYISLHHAKASPVEKSSSGNCGCAL